MIRNPATLASLVIACSMLADIKILADMRGDPCDIAGVLVDGVGQPLQDVRLEVVVTELAGIDTVRSTTNIVVNGIFALHFPSAAELSLIARKEGYSVGTAHLNRRQLNSKDIILRLLPAPPLTRLVEVTEAQMRLHYDGTSMGLLLETGEMAPTNMRPDMFLQMPTGWSPASNGPPPSVRLCLASGGGVQPMRGERDKYASHSLRICVEAPEDGYVSELEIPLQGQSRQLLYFRTPAGLYGKIDLEAVKVVPDRRQVWVLGRYFFQPDGSRNLNNDQSLRVFRAKPATARLAR